MYKIVFVDVDGTLTESEGVVSAKTKNVLKQLKDKGIECVISSGRPRVVTADLSKKVNASNYIISATGGDVYDYNNNVVISSSSIKPEAIRKLIKMAEEEDVNLDFITKDKYFVRKFRDGDPYAELFTLLPDNIDEFLNNNEVLQCVIFNENLQLIKNLITKVEKFEDVRIANKSKCLTTKEDIADEVNTFYFDIVDNCVSKGYGIKKLCDYLNIDLKDAIAIGDGYNDISMFDVVDLGIAMGNSSKEVKSKAKLITLTNKEDGLAFILEELLLK